MCTVHLAFCTTEVHFSPSESMDRNGQNSDTWPLDFNVILSWHCATQKVTFEKELGCCVCECVCFLTAGKGQRPEARRN